MSKRKRIRDPTFVAPVVKKRKLVHQGLHISKEKHEVSQPLLNHCYREVKTLRNFLLEILPSTSRLRRRRITQFSADEFGDARFLDTTLVGISQQAASRTQAIRREELARFTHTQRGNACNSAATQSCSFDEIVDFVVCSLFKNHKGESKKPSHILCQGLERSVACLGATANSCKPVLPGILQRFESAARRELKKPIWRMLMSVLGADGETIFTNLLLDCGLFLRLENGTNNFRQISGVPLHDLCLQSDRTPKEPLRPLANSGAEAAKPGRPLRKPCDISIVRSRMFYGKPSLNQNGAVKFGLKHMHILNRCADLHDQSQDLNVMRYVFPRQSKLHNVFTSPINRKETVQAFKDYTFREDEVRKVNGKQRVRIPRRLRGGPLQLIRKLRHRHRRCPYDQLLAHYCPTRTTPGTGLMTCSAAPNIEQRHYSQVHDALQTQMKSRRTQTSTSESSDAPDEVNTSSLLPFACAPVHVSSFCRAVLQRILPHGTFGVGKESFQNWHRFLACVDKFVYMRKYETISLHELNQGLKIKCIEWLIPNDLDKTRNIAVTDKRKREEVLQELLYYTFDSILVPLIASNFYVTESGIHRNKLLYFRHDVWIRLCQPFLASVRLGSFVTYNAKHAQRVSKPDQLDHSLVRMLPKEMGIRSITNLRRRTLKLINGKRILVPSVNALLAPVFDIFNYERNNDLGVFKSDSFSIQDLHAKLARYKTQRGDAHRDQLYFVKVDIRSAFDSIPQEKLVALVNKLFKNKHYLVSKHAESKMLGGPSNARTCVKFIRSAQPSGTLVGAGRTGTAEKATSNSVVRSDTDHYQHVSRSQAQTLFTEHVQANIVKLGNKYYRQSEGIPQGSILSSLLCTFFYNDFERCKLGFLDSKHSLLLRLIDDFLLITTNKSDAIRFVKAMKAGDASYGIFLHPEKSLVNFDMVVDTVQIPKLSHSSAFPYCGLLIDTDTLAVSKDRIRKDNMVANSLTVDLHGRTGEKFIRRLLTALRIQLQSILLDPFLNDETRILRTMIECFQETAMKMHQYCMNLPKAKRPRQEFLINLIERLIGLAHRAVGSRETKGTDRFTRPQICCLAASAILRVLSLKNTNYHHVLRYLHTLKAHTEHSLNLRGKTLEHLVNISFASLKHYLY